MAPGVLVRRAPLAAASETGSEQRQSSWGARVVVRSILVIGLAKGACAYGWGWVRRGEQPRDAKGGRSGAGVLGGGGAGSDNAPCMVASR